ncbi:MFS transporter [Aquabacterium sp.]|uniref:MFS transporter n=1 Tax=Aquabacterium sp. TaxID=1872578 RepID=UPI0037831C40
MSVIADAPRPVPAAAAGRPAWAWVPSLYFAQGLPYAMVMMLSVVFYKRMDVSNTELALYTSWLYLPWVIKPLWSPLVELLACKRQWIVAMQVAVGSSLALVALAVPLPGFFQWTLAVFWLMAFASATHDIAADGFYMLALPASAQAAWVGVRSACWRLAVIAAQGGLVMLAGALEQRLGQVQTAWALVFGVSGGLFVLLALLHARLLPRPAADRADPVPARGAALAGSARAFAAVFGEFFRRPGLAHVLSFLLLYRLAEAQLLKLATPFLLDSAAQGGLGLSTQQVGLVYGGIGVACLTAGGLLGGWVIAQHGLQRWLWPMLLAMHLPNLLFVALAAAGPSPLPWVAAAVALEQFGYGFGFSAYLVYMLWVAAGPTGDNPHRTAHYALCTGWMALGMMLPGMWSGWLQAQLGYFGFFAAVCLSALPSFVVVARTRLDPAFGRRAA